MDQIEKFIKRLNKKWAKKIEIILLNIVALQLKEYDVKKLGDYKNLFRIRVGKIRIVFRKFQNYGEPIYIEYRGKAYNKKLKKNI